MTKAFIAGFMSKCAEAGLSQKQAVALLAKEAADAAPVAPAVAAAGAGKTVKKPFSNGGVSPGTIAGDAKMVGAVNNAVSQIFPRGGSIHTPITHKDVGNAINFASANGLKGDPNLKMNKPMVDMLLQQKVDTLPDPGPGAAVPSSTESRTVAPDRIPMLLTTPKVLGRHRSSGESLRPIRRSRMS